MAVLQMDRIHLCAMKRDRKTILELLQRRQMVEIRDLDEQDDVFEKTDTSTSKSMFEKSAETAARAQEIVNQYSPAKGSMLAFLQGRTALTVEENDAFYDRKNDVLAKAQRILQLERDVAEAKAEILRVEAQEEALGPWMNLPVPQTFSGTKKTTVFIGSLEGELTLEEVLAQLAEATPELGAVHVEIVSTAMGQTNLYIIALKKDAQKVEEALRTMSFARPPSASHHMPEEKEKELAARKAEEEKTLSSAQEEIESYGGLRDDLRMLQDHMTMRAEKYDMIQKLAQTKHVFILDGYVPSKDAPALQRELQEKFDCLAEVQPNDPADEEEPVLLKNSWFCEPLEGVLESYSLPGKGELDPTTVMSFFYYFMFGLMFSDAGYGLLMAGICGILLLKFKNMEPNWSKNLRLFFWCGVSTIFWGVMLSSYFGDAVTVISTVFIDKPVSISPVMFDPLQNPMLLLMICLAIGIVHLTVGYVMKGVTCAKNGQYKDILYDAVFPAVMLFPLVLILMGTAMFEGMAGFKLTLPPMAMPVCLAISGVCMLGVLLTGGRESKNWFKRLLKGAYALYNALAGWLSDILSYSRLLALGLATGVIASVMNQLGTMLGGGIAGLLLFIVVFVVGQALNFGINVLGAYVHSNRLEYVEFFGKFYEGGGRKFIPFGIHTKYYKIEEET